MSVIWTVEESFDGIASLTSFIAGNFAIRRFASFSSMMFFLRTMKTDLPSAVIVATSADRSHEISEFVSASKQAPAFVCLREAASPMVCAKAGKVHVIPLADLTGPALVRFIKEVQHSPRHAESSVLTHRDIRFDFERFECTVRDGERPVTLTLKEAKLLKVFMQNANVPLTRETIQDAVWGEVRVAPRTMDSHISRLRQRLVDTNASIESIYGGGYVFR